MNMASFKDLKKNTGRDVICFFRSTNCPPPVLDLAALGADRLFFITDPRLRTDSGPAIEIAAAGERTYICTPWLPPGFSQIAAAPKKLFAEFLARNSIAEYFLWIAAKPTVDWTEGLRPLAVLCENGSGRSEIQNVLLSPPLPRPVTAFTRRTSRRRPYGRSGSII